MAKETLAVPEEQLPQVIEIIRHGCDYYEDIVDFEETVAQLRRWCDEEQEYLDSLPSVD
jgi:hypothetical protein